MNRSSLNLQSLLLVLVLALPTGAGLAQESVRQTTWLSRNLYRGGEETLRAFAPVSTATRDSIVKLNVDGVTVALGTVIDGTGLVVTKSSELKPGRLTGWLANGREVRAERVSSDEELDLALVKIDAPGLKPIAWAGGEPAIGQWAITPGIAETPHAVGVVSAQSRRIRPERPYLGVQFENNGFSLQIEDILPGLGAERAGIRAGDTLLSVNGEAMSSRNQVVDKLRGFREGQSVTVQLRRGEELIEAEVLLMPASAEGGTSASRTRRLSGATSRRVSGFEQVIEHDTVLQPWLCGGPLVDLEGRGLGINIARAGRVSTYALPSSLVLASLEKMKIAAASAKVR